MSNFKPGKELKKFKTKSGKPAIIRYFQWEDLDEMVDYVNKLSQEDTYVSMSGEKISKNEEADFLAKIFKTMEFGLGSTVGCFINNKLAGITSINITAAGKRARFKHQAGLGMSVRKQFRSDGVGSALMEAIIDEAKQLPALKQIRLSVLANNPKAIKLYEKFGFVKHGEIPNSVFYKGQYVGEIEMSVDLT